MPAFHAFEPAARIIVATLFNSLWEDAILALIVWAILRFATNVNATTRYALWISALVAAIVLPLVSTIPFVTTVTHQAHVQSHASAASAATIPVSKPVAAKTVPAVAAPAKKAAQAPAMRLPERFHFSVPAVVAVALFGVWALIALALMLRVLVGLVRLERLKSDSLPLPLEYREQLARWAEAQKGGRDVRLCVSDKIEVPVAVGLFDAMILIPQHLLDTLSQEEIDQITLHELAHLRRGDDWTNGLQRVIQSLFFFNPAILWMAQQLDLEREVACDDWVLLQTNEVRPYAFCLTKMAEVTAWPHRAIAAPGVFVTRKSLSIRVERLLRAGRDIRTSVTFGPATIVGAMVIVLFFVLQTVAPSFAFADEDTTVVTSEPSVTQPGKYETTVIQRRGGHTEVQQFDGMDKGKVPQRVPVPGIANGHTYTIVTGDSKTYARLHQRFEAMPVIPPMPVIPKMPVISKMPVLPKMPAMPKGFHPHVPPVPPIAVVVQGPDAAQINAAVRNATKYVNVAAIASSAATSATRAAIATRFSTGHVREIGTLNGANCVGCDLSGVNWSGRDMHNAKMSGVDFSGADLHNVNFSGASLTGVDFSKANLRGANFSGAKLSGCDLSGADLTGANLNVATFVGCDLDARHLAPEQARLLLSKCTGCDFHDADLRNQDLRNIHISGDDLSGADLRGANLDGAELVGIDLSNAKLDGAHLNGTKFSGCDFDGVDMSGVDLSHASITGGKFRP